MENGVRGHRLSPEGLIYAALVGVLLLPIWTHRYFTTQDGPMHLHNARILLDHLQSRHPTVYDEYYVPNLRLFPYWFGHVSLALLLTVFPPAIAEKFFLSCYIVAFALVLRVLVRQLDPRATLLSFLGLPLICMRPFQMGFLGFCFSLVFLLLIIRFWIRCQGEMTHGRLLGLTALFLLLYFCHGTTYVFAIAVISSLIVFGVLGQPPQARGGAASSIRSMLERHGVLLLAILPSLLLLVSYAISAPSYKMTPHTSYGTILDHFARQNGLTLMTSREAPLGLAVAALFLVLGLSTFVQRLRSRKVIQADGFLLGGLIALGIHLYGSLNGIGFFERMETFPLLMLLLWSCIRPFTEVQERMIAACAGALVIAAIAIRWGFYARASANVEELMSVLPAIEDRSTVLPLNFMQFGQVGGAKVVTDVLPLFLHTPDYLGASRKQVVMLDNIGGLYPMFPYMWRADRNPYEHIETNEGLEHMPPSAEFASYRDRTGGTVDYVVTWGASGPLESHPYSQRMREQLDQTYERTFTSPHGQAVVFRHAATPRKVDIPLAPGSRDTVNRYVNLSLELYRAGKYTECIQAAQRALAVDPRSDRAYNNMCAAYVELGIWDKAIEAGERAVAINPSSELARNNLDWARKRKSAKR